ncbi:uncharacterized protein LOC143071676 isoform X3 [Mytilus galloprovincialis]|uniref:uncharacterized protein LOC143071676 isoform X3 n=1 Tax=Mytilus galloprovincialis TaxID=29158 RepID=UPI003F7CB9B4
MFELNSTVGKVKMDDYNYDYKMNLDGQWNTFHTKTRSLWMNPHIILPPIREEMNDVMDDSDDEDSNLISWGCGEFGQHGHGIQEDVPIDDGLIDNFINNSQVKMVACGASHVIVVTNDNQILGWGNGNSGQLGNGTTETNWHPKPIYLLDNQKPNPPIAGVACGGRHTMVWLTNGNVFSFGNNFYAQLGYDFKEQNYKENQTSPHLLKFLVYRPVVQVSCGEKHSVFRFQGGSIACIGCNSQGQIGSDNREEAVVPRFLDINQPIRFIASGANHNLAITGEGQVYQWGYGKSCGDKNKHLLSPTLVEKLTNVVRVAAGASHSMALTASGSVYVWGSGADGQLGLGDKVLFITSPKRLKDSSLHRKVTYISSGECYSAAITENGKLYMWGKNSHCILPNRPTSFKIWTPFCVNTGLKTVTTISCGSWHAVALTGIPDPVPYYTDGKSDITEVEIQLGKMVDVNGRHRHKDSDDTSEESEDDFKERLPNIAPRETALDGEVVLSVTVEYPEELLHKRLVNSPSLSSEQKWQQTVQEKQETDRSRLVIQMPSEAKPHFIDASTSPIPFSSSESESDGALHSSLILAKLDNIDDDRVDKLANTPSQKSVSRYPLFFDRQKTNALKEQPSSVVQFSKTNAENYTLPRENTNFSCKQIDLTELEVIKTIHDLKSQEKIVRANLINETGQTFIESPVSKLYSDNKLRDKIFTRSSEKSSPTFDNGRIIDSPIQKSGRHSDTAILNLAMRDRLSVTKSHRSVESALAEYYSLDDGRWPVKQSNSIPKKGDADFGKRMPSFVWRQKLKISRSDTVIGPIKSPTKMPTANHIQRYSNVHNPINSQKTSEYKSKIRIPVPRQVSIPVGREQQQKTNNLRVEGKTRKQLMYSSATSWRSREQNGLLDMSNSCQSGSPLSIDSQNKHKGGEINGKIHRENTQKLLNGHVKSPSIYPKGVSPMKRRSKTTLGTAFNMEHFHTAMDFDNDLKIDPQTLVQTSEQNGQALTSVSQVI